jgi:alpha-L-arabinofuranosidase
MNIFKNRRSAIAVCILVTVAISGFSQSTVTFNVSGATTVIPKEIFGVLMERLGRQWSGNGAIFVGTASTIPNTNGMRNDVINGFVECGVGSAEWPGGCAANSYAWNPPNPANEVGTDRFMQFCNLVGCEPVLCGPGYSTSAASNLAWVTYINNNSTHPEWTVKYFKIGNEVWGCGGNQNVGGYSTNYTANYNSLHAPINGKTLFLVAGNDMEGNWAWLTTMLNNIGGQINGVEYHDYIYYPDSYSSTNPTTANYWQIMNDILVGDIHSHLYNNVFPAMNTYDPSKRIKIVLDEWGDWLIDTGDGWMQQITVMDAVSTGAHLNLFMQNADRIGVACLAQGVSCIHSLININTSGVMVKTPAFYVFKMLKPHHTNSAKVVPITASSYQTVSGVPAVTACASVDNTGIVNISFTNVDLTATRAVTVTLTSSVASYSVLSAEVVTGANMNSCNAFGAAESVNIQTLAASNYSIGGKTLTVTALPTKSVVMFRLQPPVAVQPGSFRQNGADAFSVRAGSRGTVLVSSTVGQKTPVTISLYSVDGRTLIDRVSRSFEAGNSTCVLGNKGMGRGVCIVKITGADINLSKKVVIAR